MSFAGPGAPMVGHGAVGDQVVRCGAGDGGGDDVAGTDPGAAGREVHQPAVARASPHARGAGVLAAFARRDQQLDGAADLRAVFFQRDLLLQLDQALIAFGHNSFRKLAVQFGRRGARPLRVLEGERADKSGRRDDVERGLEVFFGLAGKPDDDVGGDRGVRDGRAHFVDDAEIAFGAIGAAHRAQIRSEPDCIGM